MHGLWTELLKYVLFMLLQKRIPWRSPLLLLRYAAGYRSLWGAQSTENFVRCRSSKKPCMHFFSSRVRLHSHLPHTFSIVSIWRLMALRLGGSKRPEMGRTKTQLTGKIFQLDNPAHVIRSYAVDDQEPTEWRWAVFQQRADEPQHRVFVSLIFKFYRLLWTNAYPTMNLAEGHQTRLQASCPRTAFPNKLNKLVSMYMKSETTC